MATQVVCLVLLQAGWVQHAPACTANHESQQLAGMYGATADVLVKSTWYTAQKVRQYNRCMAKGLPLLLCGCSSAATACMATQQPVHLRSRAGSPFSLYERTGLLTSRTQQSCRHEGSVRWLLLCILCRRKTRRSRVGM
jgi:hypothetical protein